MGRSLSIPYQVKKNIKKNVWKQGKFEVAVLLLQPWLPINTLAVTHNYYTQKHVMLKSIQFLVGVDTITVLTFLINFSFKTILRHNDFTCHIMTLIASIIFFVLKEKMRMDAQTTLFSFKSLWIMIEWRWETYFMRIANPLQRRVSNNVSYRNNIGKGASNYCW